MDERAVCLTLFIIFTTTTVTANPAFSFAGRYNRKDFKAPFDDDEADPFSGESTFFGVPSYDQDPLSYQREKSLTEVEVILPDDDELNDSMNLDDIYGTEEFDLVRKPGNLQANRNSFDVTYPEEEEEDLDTIDDDLVWSVLNDYGIFPKSDDYADDADNAQYDEDPTEDEVQTTAIIEEPVTTSTQGSRSTVAFGESSKTTEEMKSTTSVPSHLPNTTANLITHQTTRDDDRETVFTTIKMQTADIGVEEETQMQETVQVTSTTKPALSQSTKVLQSGTSPAITKAVFTGDKTEDVTIESPRTPTQKSFETVATKDATTSDGRDDTDNNDALSTPATDKTEKLVITTETVKSTTFGMTMEKESRITVTEKQSQRSTAPNIDTVPAGDPDASLTQAAGSDEKTEERFEPADVTDVLPTIPQPEEEDKDKPDAAMTEKVIMGIEVTTGAVVASAQTEFSTIVLIVCIISLLIVLVLVVVIIIIVRARLKKRGKYEITSDVDSTDACASGEGGKANVAQDPGAKSVITVQYNDASA